MAAGDESALAALYDRWATQVHTVAYWILKDADEAEDVVEETFWQAWRSARRFDERRAAGSTWLLLIARSRALDRLRQRRRWDARVAAAAAAEGMLEGIVAPDPGLPDLQAELMERASGVASAVSSLPPEQRKVVEMAFFGGLSHAEIAQQTALPLGTVKTRLRLAMRKLRQRLAALYQGET